MNPKAGGFPPRRLLGDGSRSSPERAIGTIGAEAGPEASVAARASADDDVRMPGILTRAMAGELLKTILLTTCVLVSVIAFGAAIKPLARNLLGGADILRYIALASVPMLQYALPFSAGFGATLVMHRMASDNEIIAMSAAGLSHGRILRPVMLLGAALLVVMLVLVNLVVPVFWTRMETMLARDVTRLLASSVERGEAFDLGDTRIYADDVQIFDDPEGTTAEMRLVLVGVAAIQTAGEDLVARVGDLIAEATDEDVMDGMAPAPAPMMA